MSTAGWASCLDSFAQHLEQQRAALVEGAPEAVTPFVPPPALGPLPVTLLPRARQLHAEAEALTDVITEARSRVQAALLQLRQPSQSARPAYVDSHA